MFKVLRVLTNLASLKVFFATKKKKLKDALDLKCLEHYEKLFSQTINIFFKS